MLDVGHRDVVSPSSDARDDDDRDTSTSVAETNTTDMTAASEDTSQGSLTSVD